MPRPYARKTRATLLSGQYTGQNDMFHAILKPWCESPWATSNSGRAIRALYLSKEPDAVHLMARRIIDFNFPVRYCVVGEPVTEQNTW